MAFDAQTVKSEKAIEPIIPMFCRTSVVRISAGFS